MAKKYPLYRCPKCGNIVEMLKAGSCVPTCCGEPMEELVQNPTDDPAVLKKHQLSVVEDDGNDIVKIGAMGHPMKKDHYIEWVEIISACGAVHRRHLNPGDEPESWFLPPAEHVHSIRAYCSQHGLWEKNWPEE